MKKLSLEALADYLETATIMQTLDVKHAIIHEGINASGIRFVIVNNCHGETMLSEAI